MSGPSSGRRTVWLGNTVWLAPASAVGDAASGAAPTLTTTVSELELPAESDTVSRKTNWVGSATLGAVKVAVFVLAPLRSTDDPES